MVKNGGKREIKSNKGPILDKKKTSLKSILIKFVKKLGIINKGPILDRKNTILESILVEIAENEGKKGQFLLEKRPD